LPEGVGFGNEDLWHEFLMCVEDFFIRFGLPCLYSCDSLLVFLSYLHKDIDLSQVVHVHPQAWDVALTRVASPEK